MAEGGSAGVEALDDVTNPPEMGERLESGRGGRVTRGNDGELVHFEAIDRAPDSNGFENEREPPDTRKTAVDEGCLNQQIFSY